MTKILVLSLLCFLVLAACPENRANADGGPLVYVSSADFNLDGYVNSMDYDIFNANLGMRNATPVSGDANGDRKVDLLDFSYLRSRLGTNNISPTGDTLLYDENGNLVVRIYADNGQREIHTYAGGLFSKDDVLEASILNPGDTVIKTVKQETTSSAGILTWQMNIAEKYNESGKLIEETTGHWWYDQTTGNLDRSRQTIVSYAYYEDGSPKETKYITEDYDENGNVTSSHDMIETLERWSNGNSRKLTRIFNYYGSGGLLFEKNTIIYRYDGAGNPMSPSTYAIREYTYNEDDLLSEEIYSSFAHDIEDNPMSAGRTVTEYSYNEDNLLEERVSTGYRLTADGNQLYDGNDDPIRTHVLTVRYEYNADGSVGEEDSTRVMYDITGSLQSSVMSHMTYTYNPNGTVKDISQASSGYDTDNIRRGTGEIFNHNDENGILVYSYDFHSNVDYTADINGIERPYFADITAFRGDEMFQYRIEYQTDIYGTVFYTTVFDSFGNSIIEELSGEGFTHPNDIATTICPEAAQAEEQIQGPYAQEIVAQQDLIAMLEGSPGASGRRDKRKSALSWYKDLNRKSKYLHLLKD